MLSVRFTVTVSFANDSLLLGHKEAHFMPLPLKSCDSYAVFLLAYTPVVQMQISVDMFL